MIVKCSVRNVDVEYLCLVQSKFNIPDDDTVSLVLEMVGCLVETEELPSVISLQQPLVILCGAEIWATGTNVMYVYAFIIFRRNANAFRTVGIG